ncbi:unnamed protein product [Rhizophagus irregularis]|nr:unnamed protein product [Rhizophagus irregularis]
MNEIRQDYPIPEPNKVEKTSRKKRSWTWEYFENVDIEEHKSDNGEPLKRCKVLDANGKKCGTLYVNDGSTGNAIIHLLNDHEITKEGKMNKVGY